ncbi:hypothetical protein ACTXT7_007510 [Hymenolepis weldensis]
MPKARSYASSVYVPNEDAIVAGVKYNEQNEQKTVNHSQLLKSALNGGTGGENGWLRSYAGISRSHLQCMSHFMEYFSSQLSFLDDLY